MKCEERRRWNLRPSTASPLIPVNPYRYELAVRAGHRRVHPCVVAPVSGRPDHALDAPGGEVDLRRLLLDANLGDGVRLVRPARQHLVDVAVDPREEPLQAPVRRGHLQVQVPGEVDVAPLEPLDAADDGNAEPLQDVEVELLAAVRAAQHQVRRAACRLGVRAGVDEPLEVVE